MAVSLPNTLYHIIDTFEKMASNVNNVVSAALRVPTPDCEWGNFLFIDENNFEEWPGSALNTSSEHEIISNSFISLS